MEEKNKDMPCIAHKLSQIGIESFVKLSSFQFCFYFCSKEMNYDSMLCFILLHAAANCYRQLSLSLFLSYPTTMHGSNCYFSQPAIVLCATIDSYDMTQRNSISVIVSGRIIKKSFSSRLDGECSIFHAPVIWCKNINPVVH